MPCPLKTVSFQYRPVCLSSPSSAGHEFRQARGPRPFTTYTLGAQGQMSVLLDSSIDEGLPHMHELT
eukprot:37450-Eustigmatos_ZCMA.PRE.1